jgi:hypothetical protein
MKFILIVIFSVSFIQSAAAQFDKFTGNTVFQAIQCDAGRFGKYAIRKGVNPRMKAHVVYSYTVEKSQKVAASVGLSTILDFIVKGPSVEASRNWTRTDGNKMEGNFNINEGNTGACGRGDVPRVPVGIYVCFKEATDGIKENIVQSCDKTWVAAAHLGANGTFKWYFIEAGADGDYDAKVTYVMNVSAPAKDEDEKIARHSERR